MQICQHQQCFDLEDGQPKFIYTAVLLRHDGKLWRGRLRTRNPGTDCRMDEVDNLKQIPEDALFPRVPPGSVIPPIQSSSFFLKKTNILSVTLGASLKRDILRELAVCDLIMKHPHPNIAIYHGCQSINGRVTGLYFEKYPRTLSEIVNPSNLNKSMLITADRGITVDVAEQIISGIGSGLKHLKHLGLSHNDVHPGNVMVKDDNTPVIIDFDSCRHTGESMEGVKRTYGWYDPEVSTSQESNDLSALEEVRSWLLGSTPAEYQFFGG
jgi:serine/threonine protein kinase